MSISENQASFLEHLENLIENRLRLERRSRGDLPDPSEERIQEEVRFCMEQAANELFKLLDI